jgi:hypothetical protein
MSLRRVVQGAVLLCLSGWMAVAAAASEYHGQVMFGGQPLPGSTVTVTATQGDKKAVAVSDDQGVFAFPDLADGTWTLTITMTGFAPLMQQVTVAPHAQAVTFELKLLSLDQIRAEDKPLKVDMTQLAAAPAAAADALPGAPGAGVPANGAAAGKAAAGAPGTAPVQSAAAQQTNGGILINGSQSNAATSQFSMNQAFGNNRNRRSLYNGSLTLNLNNSALDATQYSLTGTPVAKPQFNNYTAGANFGGPLNIPHLMPRGPYFGVFYTHSQDNNFNTQPALIPTGEDASGNWTVNATSVYVPTNLATVAPGCDTYLQSTGITQASISAGTATFPNNIIPAQCVAHASTVLLGLYPQAPNLTGDPVYNYQQVLNDSSAADTAGLQMSKGIGKNYFNGRWNFSDTRNTTPKIFHLGNNGFVDTSATLGINGTVNWSRSLTQRLRNTLSYSYSRQRSQTIPFFANTNNIEGTAGITGASSAPNYWGPPSLGFSSGIAGLSDGIFSYNRNQTNSVREAVTWNRMRHNVEFGGGFNRLEFNYLTQSNPDGSLSFTGAATRSAAGAGGSDLADFLLGVPDTSTIAYGNADKYLRQSTYNLYVNDDFRVNPELSIVAGLRWEYESPVSETKGRLVNLDTGQNFSTATPVTGSNPLLHPDYSRPEPQIGIAWRPISGSSLLIHSGYGIANDTSVYQQPAYAMAQQAPLSTSLSISNGTGCVFNIANPFPTTGCGTATPDTFAIDPNFRIGYVQSWNLQVQRDLPFSMQMVATYLGIKGTHGVQEFLPNTCAPTSSMQTTCNGNPSGYIYRTSNGNLEREAGTIQLRRRPRNGFEAGVTYTFAKSLDDDYSLGAQGSVTNGSGIAQDWTNPRGQRGLSTTDQRHLVAVTAQYTTGMGIGGKALLSGWRGAIYKDWSIHADFSAGSGLPETPIYAGATIVGAGVPATVRPNIVGSPYANRTAGVFLNAAAYAAPTLGTFGDARRDSIEGPDTFSLNANMLRTFRLHGRYSLDASLTATNVLNHVVYGGWNVNWTAPVAPSQGSTTTPRSSFGAPLSVNGMRSVSIHLTMRF